MNNNSLGWAGRLCGEEVDSRLWKCFVSSQRYICHPTTTSSTNLIMNAMKSKVFGSDCRAISDPTLSETWVNEWVVHLIAPLLYYMVTYNQRGYHVSSSTSVAPLQLPLLLPHTYFRNWTHCRQFNISITGPRSTPYLITMWCVSPRELIIASRDRLNDSKNLSTIFFTFIAVISLFVETHAYQREHDLQT